jgi:ATP-dependent DNA helicase 2 subunit 1
VSKSGDGLSLLSSLISNVNSRQTAKRALFSNLALELAPGLTISVNGYNVFQRQAPQRSCYVWLDGDQPQLALGETTKISDDSAKTVERGELKKVYKFGGKFVYFSPDEQKELRTFGTPMIRVLGFKPRAAVPVWATVNKSTFIFPSEAGFVGSTRVFAALWQKLLRDDKVGIAWAVTRTNAAPRLVALVASREQADDESGTPYLPAGLWLYPLPFADDLRATPEPAASTTPYREPSDPLKDKMRVIVQQLQLPRAMYDPSKYPNPSLQWHYKILQALALQDEVPDKPDDATVPRYKAIAKRAGGYIEEYDALLRKEAGAGAMVVGRLKREAGVGDDDDDDVKPAKKVRKVLGDAGGGMGDGQMREAVRAGTVQKMTVVQLKEWLEARGMDTAGRKADLVARVTEWAG